MSFYKPTKPSKRVGTDNYQFVRRVKRSLLNRIDGHRIQVLLPAFKQDAELSIDIEVRPTISFSLGTKNLVVASDRVNLCDNVVNRLFDELESGKKGLGDSQIERYAESVILFYKEKYMDCTGLPSENKTLETLSQLSYHELEPLAEILKKDHRGLKYWEICEYTFYNGYDPKDTSREAVEFRVGSLTNWWMFNAKIRLSVEDRSRLTLKVDQVARYAEFVGPTAVVSEEVNRPALVGIASIRKQKISFESIFEAWKVNQTRYETIRKRKTAIDSLKRAVKHDDVGALTYAELVKWRDDISSHYAPITVNNVMISGIKAVFAFAEEIELIGKSPVSKLRRMKIDGDSDEGASYTDQEVQRIVLEARKEADPILRYIVLLLAATGARFGEIAMLGFDQVHLGNTDISELPNWLEIRNSSFGAKMKVVSARRKIPLTRHLIEPDFYDFVKSRHGKPLFYDPIENPNRQGQQHDNLRSKTGPWIAKFPKSDPEVDTHHGFRHWIYTRAGDVKVRREIVNDFTGHKRQGAQGGYGLRDNVRVLSEELEQVFKIFTTTDGK